MLIDCIVAMMLLIAPRPSLDVARAISAAVEADAKNPPLTTSHNQDAALLTLYAWRESGFSIHPHSTSWDSKAGVSCGVWQMHCSAIQGKSLTEQATMWISWARQGGLAGLDSSPARAAVRELSSRKLLARALADIEQ
jgi:hypothetical protein